MDQISIYLTDEIKGYGSEIHRPPNQVQIESFGVVVQWTDDEELIIPWSQIFYITRTGDSRTS
jgi:hypothetical protein